MRNLIILVAATFYSNLLVAQQTTFSIHGIDSIVKGIDSTAIFVSTSNFVIKNKKEKKNIGSGIDSVYANTQKNKLSKVTRITNWHSDNVDCYYFLNDTLIYLKTIKSIWIGELTKKKYFGEYYYSAGKLIYKLDDYKSSYYSKHYLRLSNTFLTDFKH
jgi:hypothetical protein